MGLNAELKVRELEGGGAQPSPPALSSAPQLRGSVVVG